MGFWETFRESYRVARTAETVSTPDEALNVFDAPKNNRSRIAELEAALGDRDAQLAERKQLIADLAAEMQRLEDELKISRRTEGKGGGDSKYQKLRRLVVKKVHPDRALGDEKLKAVLESICKELNAEIDRIEGR